MSALSTLMSRLLGHLRLAPTSPAVPTLTAAEAEAIQLYGTSGAGKDSALSAYRNARDRGVPVRGTAMLFMREVDNPIPDVMLRHHFRTALQEESR